MELSLSRGRVATLSPQQLEQILQQGKIIREDDTQLSGFIRIIEFEGRILLQEKSDKNEFVVRTTPSLESAREFVAKRLDAYERMWDG